MNGRARPILLGSILLLLSFSSFTVFRALSTSSSPPFVSRLIPTLSYYEVNRDSQVSATITLSNGCLQPTSWGTPVQSENNFSVTAKVTDYSGPQISCTLAIVSVQYTYNLGHLYPGLYSFTLDLCKVFIGWGTTNTNSSKIMDTMTSTDCSSTRTIFFVVPGNPAPHPPPVRDWYMIFGPFAIIIMMLLRLLRIP